MAFPYNVIIVALAIVCAHVGVATYDSRDQKSCSGNQEIWWKNLDDSFEIICEHKCCRENDTSEIVPKKRRYGNSELRSDHPCLSDFDVTTDTSISFDDETCTIDGNISIFHLTCLCSNCLTASNETWTLVDLSNKNLEDVHPCIFEVLFESIQHKVAIDLSNNLLEEINLNMSHSENLRVLDLSHNLLQQLKRGMFEGFKQLIALRLDSNVINRIRAHSFSDMLKLERLDLSNNALGKLLSGTFSSLGSLRTLDLSRNRLKDIDGSMLEGMKALQILSLHRNGLQNISDETFKDLPRLRKLHLEHNSLKHVHPEAFENSSRLNVLSLDNNKLEDLPISTFKEMSTLEHLKLGKNTLEELSPGVFSYLADLKSLDISYNLLETVQYGVFEGLYRLWALLLQNNRIGTLATHVFDDVKNLTYLDLSCNQLTALHSGLFAHLAELQILKMTNNNLTDVPISTGALRKLWLNSNALQDIHVANLTNLYLLGVNHNLLGGLQSRMFEGLSSLLVLLLQNNRIETIAKRVFDEVNNLTHLDLSNNKLRTLHSGLFSQLDKLQKLNMSNNSLQDIKGEIWPRTSAALHTFDLRGNPLTRIEPGDFDDLNETVLVLVDKETLCCFICCNCRYSQQPVPFLTCKPLLQHDPLRVVVWIVSILAIIANFSGMYSQYQNRLQINRVQYLMITNLSVSDCLMGIYLIILLTADLYYGDSFPSSSDLWRISVPCQIAGTISLLSSEASVFFITLISIDRFLRFKYPMNRRQLTVKLARVVIMFLWVLAIIISIVSYVLSQYDYKMVYAVSEVCIGLPIQRDQNFVTSTYESRTNTYHGYERQYWGYVKTTHTYISERSTASLFYSIAIFTVLNLCCFTIVGFCYTYIFIRIRKSFQKSGLSLSKREIRIAKRLFLLVFTDFCCWVPIGILSILVQAGAVKQNNPVLHVWIATVILPMNSCINPFLYALWDVIADWLRKCRHTTDRTNDIQMRQMNQ